MKLDEKILNSVTEDAINMLVNTAKVISNDDKDRAIILIKLVMAIVTTLITVRGKASTKHAKQNFDGFIKDLKNIRNAYLEDKRKMRNENE